MDLKSLQSKGRPLEDNLLDRITTQELEIKLEKETTFRSQHPNTTEATANDNNTIAKCTWTTRC